MAAAVATVLIVVVWRALFVTWAPPTTFQFDMAERVLHPWWGLSWIAIAVLSGAMLNNARVVRIPLTAIGLIAVSLQAVAAFAFAMDRPFDGSMSLLGAMLGALSVGQLAVSLVWIVLIVHWRRSAA